LRPFFYTTDPAPQRRADAQERARWSDIYVELAAAFGLSPEQFGQYTARQLQLIFERLMRRREHLRAELIEDIATAYSGCQSKEGVKKMELRIKELRSGG